MSKFEVITNSIGQELILIPAGTFMMGSRGWEGLAREDETPHEVTISKPFYMGRTEVTQGQWKRLMNTTPWKYKDRVLEVDNCPAAYISWYDAVEFCERLSNLEGNVYRLPTEAEWEFACRASTSTPFSFGSDYHTDLDKYAWNPQYDYHNYHDQDHSFAKVGERKANGFGLYDMHGNVSEWCRDWYDDYPRGPVTDPLGPSSGISRVCRGGSFEDTYMFLRSANRAHAVPDYCWYDLGFRVLRNCDSQ